VTDDPDPGRVSGWFPRSLSGLFRIDDVIQWHRILLLGLILFGAGLRIWNVGGPSFWNDEGSSSLLALQVSKFGVPYLPGAPALYKTVNYAPLYPELEGIFFLLFGVSQTVARLPAALLGTLMIPASYLLGRRLSADRVTALVFAGLTTFSTEYIAWSRQARQYILFTLLLMVAALLFARFVEAQTTRSRVLGAGLLAACVGALALADPALTLLYLPGLVIALAAYFLLSRGVDPRGIRLAMSRWRDSTGALRLARVPSALWLALALLAVLVVTIVYLTVDPPIAVRLFGDATGSRPYPFLFIPTYLVYLGNYYGAVATLAVVGAVYSCVPVRRGAVAVLGFTLGCLLSLSTLLSLIVNVGVTGPPFERYMTPVIVFILYFAAVGIVSIVRVVLPRPGPQMSPTIDVRRESPRRVALFATVTIVVFVSLMMIIPTGQTTYPSANDSQFNSTVPWAPFSFDPRYPSALYQDFQPDYELASGYVASHRLPGDVVAASWADAPTFYLGKINYVFAASPPAGFVYDVNGIPEYFLTGSVILSTVAEVEGLMHNTSGWFIEDTVSGAGLTGTVITLGAQLLMTVVPGGSDASVTLFHWDPTTDAGFLEAIESHRADLQALFGGNFTLMANWAATSGVTVPSEGARAVLLPMEPYLVTACSNGTRPLAVAISVFNSRFSLQTEFPQTFYGNDTSLIRWAAEVVTGQISDPAYSTLEPYASWYENND
jgi:uncharacterized membrane protein